MRISAVKQRNLKKEVRTQPVCPENIAVALTPVARGIFWVMILDLIFIKTKK